MSGPVVLITGPFRSGTSLVAQVVHRLGWCVASTMTPPIPPSFRADWEDLWLTRSLIDGARPPTGDLKKYLGLRRASSQALGFGGRVACKSPYLALVWPALVEACGNPLVVRCYREEGARSRSVAQYPQLSKKDGAAIQRALLEVKPSIEIGYEWAVENPGRCVEALANLVGVSDPLVVMEATKLIGKPTEY